MTCPKCQGEMRHYERSGVTVDQCVECRGIFLDRGELERLVDAESAWQNSRGQQPAPQQQHGAPPAGGYQQAGHQQGYPPPGGGYPQQQQQPYPQSYPQQQPQYGHGHSSHGYSQYGHHKRKKKKDSFFEELFD